MFITAPIWPCARRFSQMNKPTISSNGSSSGKRLTKKFVVLCV